MGKGGTRMDLAETFAKTVSVPTRRRWKTTSFPGVESVTVRPGQLC